MQISVLSPNLNSDSCEYVDMHVSNVLCGVIYAFHEFSGPSLIVHVMIMICERAPAYIPIYTHIHLVPMYVIVHQYS